MINQKNQETTTTTTTTPTTFTNHHTIDDLPWEEPEDVEVKPTFPSWEEVEEYITNKSTAEETYYQDRDGITYAKSLVIPGTDIKRFSTESAANLLKKKLAPISFIVDGLLTEGLAVFGANPKQGKTLLALDLCESISTGKKYWNRKTAYGMVLFINLEDGERRIKERLLRLKSKASDNFEIIEDSSQLCQLGKGFERQLYEWVHDKRAEGFDPKLVVIDTLKHIMPDARPGKTSYNHEYGTLIPLQKLANILHICILAITHNIKYGDASRRHENISGSQGITGAGSTNWTILNSGDKKILSVTGKDIESAEYEIKLDPDTLKWTMKDLSTQDDAALSKYKNSPLRNVIVDNVNAHNGNWSITAKDLDQLLGNSPFPSDEQYKRCLSLGNILSGRGNDFPQKLLRYDKIEIETKKTYGVNGYIFSTNRDFQSPQTP